MLHAGRIIRGQVIDTTDGQWYEVRQPTAFINCDIRSGLRIFANTVLDNCTVTHRRQQAAIYIQNVQQVIIQNTRFINCQRAILALPASGAHPKIRQKLEALTIDGCLIDGFVNVTGQPNRQEALLLHGLPARKFPNQVGFGRVIIRNLHIANRVGGVTVWEIPIDHLTLDGVTIEGKASVDIAMNGAPVKNLIARRLAGTRFIVRLHRGVKPNDFDNWRLLDPGARLTVADHRRPRDRKNAVAWGLRIIGRFTPDELGAWLRSTR